MDAVSTVVLLEHTAATLPARAGPRTMSPSGEAGAASTFSKTLLALYESDFGRLENYARGRVGDADAKDVVQQCFIEIHTNIGAGRLDGDNESALRGALFTTVRRRCYDQLRRELLWRDVKAMLDSEQATDDPERRLMVERLLRMAHDVLPPMQYAALAMVAQGFSSIEVADALNLRDTNVRQMLFRARSRLERLWSERDD